MDPYKKKMEERRNNEMLLQLQQLLINYRESTNSKLFRMEETLKSLVQEMRGIPVDKGVKEQEEFVKPFAQSTPEIDSEELSADSLTHLNLRFPKYDSEKSLTDSVDDYEGPPVFDEDPNKEDYDLEEQKIILAAWEIQEVQTPIVALELFDEGSKDEYGIITPILTSPVDTSKKALIVYVLQPSSGILFENTKFNSSHDWGGVVLWNSKIGKHVTNNESLEAFRFYTKIRDFGTKEDFSTLICLLNACCTTCDLGFSKQVPSQACKFGVVNDLIVSTELVDMYVRCRGTNDACRLFGELEMYDSVLLNSMIIIYFSVISVCVNISPLEFGEQHFALKENMLEVDCPCVTPEIGLKASGHVDKFTDLMVKDEGTGTCYRADHLLKDFCKGKLESDTTLTAEKISDFKHILAVFDDHSPLGARIKEYGPFNHYIVASFYEDSRLIVGKGTKKEVLDHVAAGLVTEGLKPFCTIYSTFLQRGYDQVVHDVDLQKIPVRFAMDRAGLVGAGAFDTTFMACLPNMVVMTPSCEAGLRHMIAKAAAIDDRPSCLRYPRGNDIGSVLPPNNKGTPLEIGKGRVIREGSSVAILGYGTIVQSCHTAAKLLENLGIYITVADANEKVSYKIPERDIISWNAMISGFSRHGDGVGALRLFDAMEKSNVQPDDITFIAVFTDCSYSGMASEDTRVLNSMTRVYNIEPKSEYLGCLIDILSKAGLFEGAKYIIQRLPHSSTSAEEAVARRALLTACKAHGNTELAEVVPEKLSKNQKENEMEVKISGKLRSPNLLAMRAYYLGPKGEKLLVFDYMPKGKSIVLEQGRPEIDNSKRPKYQEGSRKGVTIYIYDPGGNFSYLQGILLSVSTGITRLQKLIQHEVGRSKSNHEDMVDFQGGRFVRNCTYL